MPLSLRNIVSVAAMTASLLAVASPVTRRQALEAATRALAQHGVVLNIDTRQAAKAPATAQASTAPYYIFNGDNAFVIAASDDRLPAVLGYSDNGTIDPSNLPPGLEELLMKCEAQAGNSGSGASDKPAYAIGRRVINPLLKTAWGQGAPFNLMSPAIDSEGTPAAAGCVATAMAQVMFYHKWPLEMTAEIPGYLSTGLNKEIPALTAEYFPWWNDIQVSYTSDDVESINAFAAARLVQFCGQAVNTDYGISSSARTAMAVTAMPTYFQYKSSIRYLQRPYYSAEQWDQLIYDELQVRHPVIYRAQRYGGEGHAFVIDGIDADGLYHINWGWHGSANGYYALTALDVMERETTTDPACNGYTYAPAMIVGIEPNRNLVNPANPGKLSFYDLTLKEKRFTRTSESEDFEGVTITGRFTNGSSYEARYDLGFALFDGSNKMLKVISSQTLNNMYPTFGTTRDWPVKIDASITAGTYVIRPVSRVHGTAQWQECIGSRSNYAEATITAGGLTLVPKVNAGTRTYNVDNVAYDGTLQARRDVTTTVSLTNKGTCYFAYIYLLLDGTCVTASQCELRPGAHGDITMHFAPQEVGQHTVELALDSEGTNVIYSGTVNITEPTTATLAATSITVKDQLPGNLIGIGTFAATATIANNGTTGYNDDIVARLYRRSGEDQATLYGTVVKHVDIPAGKQATMECEFNDLLNAERFYLTLSYYNGSMLTLAGATPYYTMAGDYEDCDVNSDHMVDVTDLNMVVNVVLGRTDKIKPTGREDVNSDGSTDVTDINLVVNRMLRRDH